MVVLCVFRSGYSNGKSLIPGDGLKNPLSSLIFFEAVFIKNIMCLGSQISSWCEMSRWASKMACGIWKL